MGLGLLRMLSLGRAGHSKVNPVEEEASACRPSDDEGSREEGRLVIKHNERKSIQVARCPAPVELAIRCRIVRKGTMRPQYSCYLDDGTDKFLYTARRYVVNLWTEALS